MSTGLRGLLAAILLVALPPVQADESDPLRIGWTAWDDAIFVTRLAARLVEDHLDQPVELVRAGIAEQYQNVADGRLDVMLMSWQPRTHAPYLDRVAHRVEHLGVLYDGGALGWAVPDYVPRDVVTGIADLADREITERFGGRIVGIDPGAGLTRLSRRALEHYELDDYTLETSDAAAMAEALAAAVEDGEWIVVTAWNPHWIFAAHDLRYLEDPDAILGNNERVHVLAREGFYSDHPEVGALLTRMYIPLDELEAALLRAQEDGHDAAVDWYIAEHPQRIRSWIEE